MPTHTGRLVFLLAFAAVAAISLPSPIAAAVDKGGVQLSDKTLYQILYVEPNHYLQSLGNISDIPGSLSRTFLSPAHRRAAGRLRRWMASAGMRTWADQMANVHGIVKAADPEAPTIILGSHYDTVVDGGKFDGALGIIVAISAVKAVLLEAALAKGLVSDAELEQAVDLLHNPRAGIDGGLDLAELLYDQQTAQLISTPVQVVAFSDEEGVRFHSTYLGSRVLTGTLLDHGILTNIDHEGVSVLEALEQAGFDPSPASLRKMAIPHNRIKAYLEVHIEQGPVLQAVGRRLGTVAAIAGQSRLQAEIIGEQGHAGTVPMRVRRDPLAASAEVIGQLERICNGGRHGGDLLSPDLGEDHSLVCTVGSMSIWPNAGNVIPGAANFTLDIRSRWDHNRKQVIQQLRSAMEAVCARRELQCRLYVKNEAAAVESSPELVEGLLAATEEAKGLVDRLLAQARLNAPPPPVAASSPAAATCQAPADGSMQGCADAASDAAIEATSIETADEAAYGSTTGGTAAGGGTGGGAAVLDAAGAATNGSNPLELVSGAGHDAMVFAEVTKMGMLFVRCRDGISHSPLEHVHPDDVAAAAATLYRYLRKQLLMSEN
ncbi:Allantoate deiminase 2 [Chlorella vulgaris]